VHQLVAEHVVGLGERAAHREHDPALEGLGHTARPLARGAAQRVGLLELRVAAVEDDRLPLPELEVQDVAQAVVPALRHPAHLRGGVLLLRVVIDVEVVGLEHLELEVLPLHGVPAEILGLRRRGGSEGGQGRRRNEPGTMTHGA
jgi:hypothetical protein